MVLPLNPVVHKSDRLTDDEFYAFCQANRHLRLERDETGQIILQMPTNTKTGLQNADLITEVVLWNRKGKTGLVADSSAGFTLPDTSVRAPDVSWISRERWEALSGDDQDKFAKVCPDFVIESIGGNRCSDKDENTPYLPKWRSTFKTGFDYVGRLIRSSSRQLRIARILNLKLNHLLKYSLVKTCCPALNYA